MWKRRMAMVDERGMTIPEMVVTVVILGVVIVPVLLSFTEAIKFLPSSSAHTKVSVRESLIVNQLSDDVSDAVRCPLSCGKNASVVHDQIKCSDAMTSPRTVLTTNLDPNTSTLGAGAVSWTISAATPKGTFQQVILTRSFGATTLNTYELGYCATSPDAVIVNVDNTLADGTFSTSVKSKGWVHVAFSTQPDTTEPVHTIDISATTGCSPDTSVEASGCGTAAPTSST